jgi:sec-independent protein translocase protein TatA
LLPYRRRLTLPFTGGIGPLELIIVLVIVLLIFGPKRLPGLGRSLGSGMREFKDSITGGRGGEDEDEDDEQAPALTGGDEKAAEHAGDRDPVTDRRG